MTTVILLGAGLWLAVIMGFLALYDACRAERKYLRARRNFELAMAEVSRLKKEKAELEDKQNGGKEG